MSRTIEEIQQALHDQLSFLKTSCELYDKGKVAEAQRISSAVYIMLHDGHKRTSSILSQLRLKGSMSFVSFVPNSTPSIEEDFAIDAMPLVIFQMSQDGGRYRPRLNDGPPTGFKLLSFDEWWEEKVLYSSGLNTPLTRRELILTVRDQDGGGHFDGKIKNEAYVFIKGPEFGWKITTTAGEMVPEVDACLATIRHIAFELQHSILIASQWTSALQHPSDVKR